MEILVFPSAYFAYPHTLEWQFPVRSNWEMNIKYWKPWSNIKREKSFVDDVSERTRRLQSRAAFPSISRTGKQVWKKLEEELEQEENYSIALCHSPSRFAAHRIEFSGVVVQWGGMCAFSSSKVSSLEKKGLGWKWKVSKHFALALKRYWFIIEIS